MSLSKGKNLCKIHYGLFLIIVFLTGDFGHGYEYEECYRIVKRWEEVSLQELRQISEQQNGKDQLKDLLFFLHVPRTGGRTFFHCLLRNVFSNDQECPRSYDKFRFDSRKQDCRLISTHDDYSIVAKLPRENTSVVTVLRNPVDRVFSTYEFSVEVAARFLIHPNLSSAMRFRQQVNKKLRGVSTLDIWPWKYLVPWMREDLFARRDKRRLGRTGVPEDNKNSYNMTAMLLPFHEFIQHPIAHELVHNGLTFQVAGLNNNSLLEGSQIIRHCVAVYPSLGSLVLKVSKRRLEEMIYVGLTEHHKESATIFANIIGEQALNQQQNLNSTIESQSNETENTLLLGAEGGMQTENNLGGNKLESRKLVENIPKETDKADVHKIVEAYEGCVSTTRSSQGRRRISSLKRIAPANFSTQARVQVPRTLIKEIEKLNSLDMELYSHAQKLYYRQRRIWIQKMSDFPEESNDRFFNPGSKFSSLNYFWVLITLTAVAVMVYYINTKRSVLKIKV